jgi:hypothetical protein
MAEIAECVTCRKKIWFKNGWLHVATGIKTCFVTVDPPVAEPDWSIEDDADGE